MSKEQDGQPAKLNNGEYIMTRNAVGELILYVDSTGKLRMKASRLA